MACTALTIPAALAAAMTGLGGDYVTMISGAEFMCKVRTYLIDDMLIGTYREQVAAQLGTALGYLSTAIVTAWVMFQGFMIISGNNKTPIVSLLFQTIKMVAILTVVSVLAANSPWVADMVLGVQGLISAAIVGAGTDIYQIIDMNLAIGQVFNALVNGLVGGELPGVDGNELTKIAGLVGQSGPAVLVSVLAIMAEISITLAIMLAPLFLFMLLFKQTASMFVTWAKFLLGTMVSLAMLTLVGSILLNMMMQYGGAVVAAIFINGSLPAGSPVSFDVGSSSTQLAVLGTLSTALLMMIPPLIMQFFNSGASFATGAMMGMMGGGAAGMGAMGLMNAMNGQSGANGGQGALGMGGANGANGQPGIGYSNGANGAGNSNTQNLVNTANKNALGNSGDAGNTMRAGSAGLMSAENGNSSFSKVQTTQAGKSSEFRENSSVSPSNASRRGSGTDYVDAQVKNDPVLGRGGHLAVGETSVGSQVPVAGASAKAAQPVSNGSNNNNNGGGANGAVGAGSQPPTGPGVTSASAAANTPTHSAPSEKVAGNTQGGRPVSLPYGQRNRNA